MQVDYLIVGAGITGAVIARQLADLGREVMVVDRRPHAGGNVHDYPHSSGVRIHSYGAHYFRTSSDKIWEFANRFSPFFKYEAAIKTCFGDTYENWPVGSSYIRRVIGESWRPEFEGRPRNFEEASLAMMPRQIYEQFVRGYTEKQWGVPASSLAVSLAGRFEVRTDDDPRFKQSKYQGLPEKGYTPWITSMLKDIPLRLNFDYMKDRDSVTPGKLLIFTGPIDQFFSYALGRLRYRGHEREHTYASQAQYCLPCAQVNNPSPDSGAHIRTLEWKHMLLPEEAAKVKGTVITTETPCSPGDPDKHEVAFPDEANQALYKRYREIADKLPGVLICGRMGEFKYYDMDQAIARGMSLAERIIQAEPVLQASSHVSDAANEVRKLTESASQKSRPETKGASS